MSIIDTFSDRNEEEAANVLDKGFRKGYKGAKKDLRKGFRGLKKDYAAALNKIGGTSDKARTQITTARDAAIGEFDPYVAATSGAAGLYADSIGLGGDAGRDRAEDAFRVSPGYNFMVDQALGAIDRRAASRGMLGSGNTRIDTANYVTGVADREYSDYLDRLRGQQEFGANIAGTRAGIFTDAGKDVAGLWERQGTRQAAVKTGLGDIRYDFGGRMADLGYATRLGRAGVKADYLTGKDQSGLNVVGAVTGIARGALSGTGVGGGTGGESLGARLLKA